MREQAIGHSGRFLRGAAVLGLLSALSGCMTAAPPPAPATATALPGTTTGIAITAADLVGDWGLASYRNEADRARTETAAKAACGNPYTVAPGRNGGAMMYLADQTKPSEVFVKTSPDGQTYIGPQGLPAAKGDRQVMDYNQTTLVTEWLDAAVRERYGTMIFVRCGGTTR